MNLPWRPLIFIVLLSNAICGLAQPIKPGVLTAPPAPIQGLYRGDARTEISEALAATTTSHKRVLLIFGADWCYDCHVLENAFRTDPDIHSLIESNYAVVHVDIGRNDKNLDLVQRYKMDIEKGVPALAVLDSSGKLLYSDQGGEFEAARRMQKRDLMAFLARWRPHSGKPVALATH